MTYGAKLLTAVTAIGMLVATEAWAANYPERTITIVVPYPAGGTIDRLSREFGDHLAKTWGQAVIVENRAGGNGAVGVENVRGSSPDGYTLLVGGGSTHSIGPATDQELKYDPIKDFSTIAYLGDTPMVITAGPSVGDMDFKALVAKAKAAPKEIKYGSVGNSTVLAGELLNKSAGIELRHVNYKQFGPTLIDLTRGDIDLGISSLSIVLGNIQQKMVKPLAVTSKERSKLIPDVPAVAETYPGFEVLIWFGLFGPAGLPEDIRVTLHDEVSQFQKTAGRAEKWEAESFTFRDRSLADYGTFLKEDYTKWKTIAAEAGMAKK
ncbi:tripartite tricarboxylate transporter substrate binding protein [Ensifer sp. YR511]|uniref:Bug family tripartite tricarboxylate transporter substrate binding protein n=1 Tax=Ensifer sp. YR511 TaxID=1855294 RepID=UPI0008924759|nr:tripartite tricarboxylate transporter substrate binding protein [Ensifer sp. YR511]SDN41222.1 Tripartite-type tricarboxylate transporter, receptor component TctC [Ensifer sp. YR511]